MTYFILLIFFQLGAYNPSNHLCFLLNNNELLCENITKKDLSKLAGIRLKKELESQFKIVYAEVYITHKSGKKSDLFKLNSFKFNDEVKNYLKHKVFTGDTITIDNIKLENKSTEPKTYRGLEKSSFKIIKEKPIFTK
jgi:hypothetical protein